MRGFVPIDLKVTTPAPRDVWQMLMASDAEAVPYQSPEWVDSLCALGTHEDASRLYEDGDRQIVLPLVRRRRLPTVLATAASMPSAWGMGGLLASEPVGVDLVRAIFTDLAALPYVRIRIRPNPRLGDLWAAAAPRNVLSTPRRAHVIDLEGGFDKVWTTRFTKETRSRVRKAEKNDIRVERDTTGRLVPVFYDLLRRSIDRWARMQNEPRFMARFRGGIRDPIRKFETIAAGMGEACRIWVAWVNGQPAAASLVLQKGNVNDSRGAIDREVAANTGANDLIQMLAIREACEAGCRYYHLGETGNSGSLAHYKARFGAQPYSYAEYCLERLPLTRVDAMARTLIKNAIGFRDQ